METVCRKPFGSVLVGVLGLALLIAALAVVYPNRAQAADHFELTKAGSGLADVSLSENTLAEIGDYSYTFTGDGGIEYSLSGDDADDFYISNYTGDAGTVYNNRPFDFEDGGDQELNFTVEAGAGELTETFEVTVTVTGLNDRPKFTADVYECRFDEQASRGEVCNIALDSRVEAEDPEADSLTYSISDSSTLSSYLHLSPDLGFLSISEDGDGKLDADAGPSEFSVQVTVTDGEDIDGNPDDTIDDWAVIRVIVDEVADEKPLLTLPVGGRGEVREPACHLDHVPCRGTGVPGAVPRRGRDDLDGARLFGW